MLDAVVIKKEKHAGVWILHINCPYCKEVHVHGGGEGAEPHLGHRVSHCMREHLERTKGYSLIESEDI